MEGKLYFLALSPPCKSIYRSVNYFSIGKQISGLYIHFHYTNTHNKAFRKKRKWFATTEPHLPCTFFLLLKKKLITFVAVDSNLTLYLTLWGYSILNSQLFLAGRFFGSYFIDPNIRVNWFVNYIGWLFFADIIDRYNSEQVY